MPKIPWTEIENDERYVKLDPERQKQVKARWEEDQEGTTPYEDQNKVSQEIPLRLLT